MTSKNVRFSAAQEAGIKKFVSFSCHSAVEKRKEREKRYCGNKRGNIPGNEELTQAASATQASLGVSRRRKNGEKNGQAKMSQGEDT